MDKSIRILVVEDDPVFAKILMAILEDLGLENIDLAVGYEEALKFFSKTTPEIALVSLDLKRLNGVNLVEQFRKTQPLLPVVYLTNNYIETNYEYCKHTHPNRFLNKELSRLKLLEAIELAVLNAQEGSLATPGLTWQNPPSETKAPWIDKQHFFFKIGDLYKHIEVEEIDFFYAKGKMTFARVNKRNFPTNVQLKTLGDELYYRFLRIHKSYLVNLKAIDSINLKESWIEIEEERLPIGYTYRKDFMDHLKLLK